MDRKIKQEGVWALLSIRLIPASPFVVVNLVMGLTSIPPALFALLTFIGMFPGTFIYVYAGKQFATMESLSDIMSPSVVLGLILLGFFPYIIKTLFMKEKRMRNQHESHEHRNKFYTIDGVQFEGTDKASFSSGERSSTVRATDEVREAARLCLEDSGLDDGGIDLVFEDRILRLQGRVGSVADKKRAEEVLGSLRGVDQVINELLVDQDSIIQDVQGGISADPLRDVDLKLHKDVF